MNKRNFLMLAHSYKDQSIAGYWASIKLDGHRMFWDGGISRGIPCSEVPYANTLKDHIKKNPPIATGLWSRGGKAIQAPDWFLNCLPKIPLDGEAWAGVGKFQKVSSILRKDTPGDEWGEICFKVFDSPCYKVIFADGEFQIRDHVIKLKDAVAWADKRAQELGVINFKEQPTLKQVYGKLMSFECNTFWDLHNQCPLPYGDEAKVKLDVMLKDCLELGHEGLIVRDPCSKWCQQRSNLMLKVKPWHDDEAEVIGFTYGKGKYLGMMGALIVKWYGKTFKVSGFTDVERTLSPEDIYYAKQNPGETASDTSVPMFPNGMIITFKYRELTDDGLPKEARYMRPFVC